MPIVVPANACPACVLTTGAKGFSVVLATLPPAAKDVNPDTDVAIRLRVFHVRLLQMLLSVK